MQQKRKLNSFIRDVYKRQGEEINPDYAKDEMPIYGTHMPDLAVQPRSTDEVAAVMKICYENNLPVTCLLYTSRCV